jgi:hypothetical protein
MNVPEDSSLAAIRLSLGRWTTDADVELAAAATWTAVRVSIGRRPQRRSRSPRATYHIRGERGTNEGPATGAGPLGPGRRDPRQRSDGCLADFDVSLLHRSQTQPYVVSSVIHPRKAMN